MRTLILRFEGPMMSFGAVAIDERRGIARFPLKSMVVGVLANALGLGRSDGEEIERIQSAVDVASRLDRPGSLMTDYQTATAGGSTTDTRPSFMAKQAWSTRGRLMGRSNTDQTYQVWKEYRADASVAVAVGGPDDLIDAMAQAAVTPARPIFIGRKACLPTRPIFDRVVEASDVGQALLDLPFSGSGLVEIQWPATLGEKGFPGSRRFLNDLRDWTNGVPSGQREVMETTLSLGGKAA